MSSGSFKDLSRAIASSAPNLTLPLPDDLLRIISAYLEKHSEKDESDAQRLQEELLSIYQSSILNHPARIAPFLALLRTLKLGLQGSRRSLQWWDILSDPIIIHLGIEKGLAAEAKESLLDLLIYDEEEEENLKEAKATSDDLAEVLMSTWLAKSKLALEELNEHAKFVEEQLQAIMLAFGRRRPKDFLMTLDKFLVKKESRILALSLLCEFFRHQPPHLHLLLQTPLFNNLLRCLQIDTSTRAISLAMTALVMFLPHIPISSAQHLPALFNIYSRMLFWDKERRAADPVAQPVEDTESDMPPPQADVRDWAKLPYLLESDDENVPELLHYFTFLYGLYPLNFMSYIRKPQRYLRHANFPGADDLDIEPSEIRQRSEPFRQVHLMHPNFFMVTLETELTDNNRWSKSSAADVVAECMALYVPSEDGLEHVPRPRGPLRKAEPNGDIPDLPLLDSDEVTPLPSRHMSWRDTRSGGFISPEGFRPASGLHRKMSQTSQSMPSIGNSPSMPPSDRHDSPTLPPQTLGSPAHPLTEMLTSHMPARSSLYQALTNESAISLTPSTNHDQFHVNAYLESLTRDNIPQSPSMRPTTGPATGASGLKVAYLQREIQLLKNDLNFERYLKQQHLSHIGKIRRQQIREARVEAETQHLVNTNRGLKSKLEEAQRQSIQMKKETEKSKTHSRKWEAELSGKLRVLREEQKKWIAEREQFITDLATANENNNKLKLITVDSESKELAANQSLMSVQSSLQELERLQKDVEVMSKKILVYEVGERDTQKSKASEEAALSRVHLLEMELAARDTELAKSKAAFDAELASLRSNNSPATHQSTDTERLHLTQTFLDSAMAASRHRINELTLSHSHLLKRFTRLQNAYTELREHLEDLDAGKEALLGGSSSFNGSSPTRRFKSRAHARSDPEPTIYEGGPSNPFQGRRSASGNRSVTPVGGRSPVSPSAYSPFQSPQPYGQPGPVRTSDEGVNADGDGPPKIKPQSDVRVFGRGGVQNIGKKDKEKKDKAKEAEARSSTPEPGAKKEKKSVGIRGIRGFV